MISLFVAVVFAITTMPGSMAMPTSRATMPAAHAAMKDCSAMAAPSGDHAKADKQPGDPCKHMIVCLGMLGCYGMAALVIMPDIPQSPPSDLSVSVAVQGLSGLTVSPDNPPPIA